MSHFVIIALVLFGCARAQVFNLDTVFTNYAGADQAMQVAELGKLFLQFDANRDSIVSILEFNTGWRQKSYPNPQSAPLYFLLMDRIADEALNSQDFAHIFRLFDENGDGGVSLREFKQNWNAFFG